MKLVKNRRASYKAIIVYGLSLGFLIFLLKWMEHRFLLLSLSLEVYIGLIALLFTTLGIWIALKLSKQKIENKAIEKIAQENSKLDVQTQLTTAPIESHNTALITQLEISNRELEILTLLAKGHSNQETADALFISLSTVKSHVQNIFEKLDVNRRTQAIEKAKRLKIID